jgi:hypothetical protein
MLHEMQVYSMDYNDELDDRSIDESVLENEIDTTERRSAGRRRLLLRGSVQRSDTQNELRAIQQMAQRETSLIRIWKWLLILFLMAFASAVATGAFLILAQEQQDNYEDAVRKRPC